MEMAGAISVISVMSTESRLSSVIGTFSGVCFLKIANSNTERTGSTPPLSPPVERRPTLYRVVSYAPTTHTTTTTTTIRGRILTPPPEEGPPPPPPPPSPPAESKEHH
ncbi:hypothetical protein E2C01_057533 [Portunus trituberculatus]|uniref:Uncharacterized protein n=1 Tax=Portunus trituberculatus TaxID=210409 RepID=A0A5B7H1C1_PORTR|nr:hypothetical protein [Portunus trituberculatus]